eukprot:COSAG02_NODE_3942_length_6006_cov_1.503978_2_plen_87_part_00
MPRPMAFVWFYAVSCLPCALDFLSGGRPCISAMYSDERYSIKFNTESSAVIFLREAQPQQITHKAMLPIQNLLPPAVLAYSPLSPV